jgi:hypothetical protein
MHGGPAINADDLLADDRRRYRRGLLVSVDTMPGVPNDQCD